jgi:atonal protein 1/7
MGQLNTAFNQLRTILPTHGNDRELSKFETIQIAKNYIRELNGMLGEDEGEQLLGVHGCVI